MVTFWILGYILDMSGFVVDWMCLGGKREGNQYDCRIWGWKGDIALH